MAEIEYLANAGFVVVSADYRLCPQVSLFDGPIRDAMDAFAWCKSELPGKLETDAGIEIDSSQIVAWGQSAGALMALYLVNITSHYFPIKC
jgi:acetyl esterase/lipase